MKPQAFMIHGLTGAVLGIFQVAWLANLALPLRSMEIILIYAVALIIRFRFREAVLAAAVGGLSRGLLSAMPAPLWSVIYAACAALSVFLFTRIFTNRSWPGLLGLTAMSYAAFHACIALARMGFAISEGASAFGSAFAGFSASAASISFLTQLIGGAVVFAAIALLRRGADPRYLNH